MGVEPTRPEGHGILSAARLPFRHSGRRGIERYTRPPAAGTGAIIRRRGLRWPHGADSRALLLRGAGPGTDAERRAANMLAGRLRRRPPARIEPFFAHPRVRRRPPDPRRDGGRGQRDRHRAAGGRLRPSSSSPPSRPTSTSTPASIWSARCSSAASPRTSSRRAAAQARPPGSSWSRTTTRPARATSSPRRPPGSAGSAGRVRLGLGPFRLFFWVGLAPLLPSSAPAWPGSTGAGSPRLQAIPTIVLIVAGFLLIDIALSEIVPGAYDNASGVAAVLSADGGARGEPAAEPRRRVVLAGAEESFCEGSRAFVRRAARQFDRAPRPSSTSTRSPPARWPTRSARARWSASRTTPS